MGRHSFCILAPIFILVLLPLHSFGRLSTYENGVLLRVQQLLEFPPALQGWTNWTNFCYLPQSPSLTIVCTGKHITELTVLGNKTSPSLNSKPDRGNFYVSQQTLSEGFSIDSFFTTLTKLSSLKVLSLVSLGLWGSLPDKINRFWSLEVLNLSSNFIYGEIPPAISSFNNLKSLVLADNLFNGTVPNLTSLAVLEELNLSDNLLGPKLPSFGNKLVSIVLRNNKFWSEIPSQLNNFYQLQRLDISSNNFVGPIPSELFSLPSIQYLNLARNKLSGALPMSIPCSERLGFVDLSYNHLIGRLPLCIGSNSSTLVALYSWNCLSSESSNYQHPSSFCHTEALAVEPPMQNQENKQRRKLGVILGIAGGIMGGGVAIGFLLLAIFRRREAKSSGHKFEKSKSQKTSVPSSPRQLIDPTQFSIGHVSHTMRLGALGLPPYQVFTLEEIEETTNCFDPSNLMGQGSQGQLYKGWLRDGSVVVVRCMKLKQRHSPQSLLQQMEVISKLRHRHLVGILGHCIVSYQDNSNADITIFLVFEFISNGTLRSHLTDGGKREMLKWPERVAITIGVARGIQFLHTGITPGIFGHNLKIENILLDQNLTAKISSYNLPFPSRVGSGNPFNGLEALDRLGSVEHAGKDDVYQLGVILLELITGKPITSQSELDVLRLQLENSLLDAPPKLQGATDPSIRGTFAYESLRITAEITINCLSKDSSQCPSIEDVIWNLQYSAQIQDGWASSGNLSTQSESLS